MISEQPELIPFVLRAIFQEFILIMAEIVKKSFQSMHGEQSNGQILHNLSLAVQT